MRRRAQSVAMLSRCGNALISDEIRITLLKPGAHVRDDQVLTLTGQVVISPAGTAPLVVGGFHVAQGDSAGRRHVVRPVCAVLQSADGCVAVVALPVTLSEHEALSFFFASSVPTSAGRNGSTCIIARPVVTVVGGHSVRARRRRVTESNWRWATPEDVPSLDFAVRALNATLGSGF